MVIPLPLACDSLLMVGFPNSTDVAKIISDIAVPDASTSSFSSLLYFAPSERMMKPSYVISEKPDMATSPSLLIVNLFVGCSVSTFPMNVSVPEKPSCEEMEPLMATLSETIITKLSIELSML